MSGQLTFLIFPHSPPLPLSHSPHHDPEGRLQWKLSLVRGLFERSYSREEILQLFRLIDWMMVLPNELDLGFKQELRRYQEERRMPYIISIERLAIEEGILQNARESVIEVLETRFEEVPPQLSQKINQINEPSVLKQLHKRAITIGSLEEFHLVIAQLTSTEESATADSQNQPMEEN